MNRINEATLEKYGVANWGNCSEVVFLCDTFKEPVAVTKIGVVCEVGLVLLCTFRSFGRYELGLSKVQDYTYNCREFKRIVSTETIPNKTELASIDMNDTEGYIHLTDGSKLHFKLIFDTSRASEDKYNSSLAGIETEFIKSEVR